MCWLVCHQKMMFWWPKQIEKVEFIQLVCNQFAGVGETMITITVLSLFFMCEIKSELWYEKIAMWLFISSSTFSREPQLYKQLYKILSVHWSVCLSVGLSVCRLVRQYVVNMSKEAFSDNLGGRDQTASSWCRVYVIVSWEPVGPLVSVEKSTK